MRIMWFLCLCVLLAASPPELLLIDDFEQEGGWQSAASEGCTLDLFTDRMNTREGQASLRIEADFAETCSEETCYIGITHQAPDLSDYGFLRLWIKPDAQAKNAVVGIYVALTGERDFIYPIPLEKTGWHLVTAHFSDFRGAKEETDSLSPEDIVSIGIFLAADRKIKTTITIDEFVALTDLNNNKIPDIDESNMQEAAKNTEDMADRYYSAEDYEKARKYYEEAKSIYQKAGNQEKAQEMDSKARESRAWQDFTEAEEFYAQEDYVRAMEAYEKARRVFVFLGDLDMVDQIEERLEELSELTGRPVSPVTPPPTGDSSTPARGRREGGLGGLLLVLFLVLLVGVGVYVWKFRGTAAPKSETKLVGEVKEEKKLISPSEARAEEIRELKAKFVYGEISRKEYEKKLRELEEV